MKEHGIVTISNLELQAMFLSAVCFELGIHKLHESVPLHRHVCECRAGEDPDNLQCYPIRGQYSGHVTSIDQSEASILY